MECQHSLDVLSSGTGSSTSSFFYIMLNNSNNQNLQKDSMQVATLIHETDKMSSLEIAEITGKRHDAILRDIRNLLSQGVNAHNFVEVEYTDKKGEKRPCFNLTKKGCLILASGYDAKLREKIIDRGEELELEKRPKVTVPRKRTPSLPTKVKASLLWVNGVSEALRLNESSKLLLLKKVGDPLGLPTPDYVSSKGILKSAGVLLKECSAGISAQVFNQKMIEAGMMEEVSRPSSHGKEKRFKSIKGKGLDFGENQVNPNNPKETQPQYYADRFNELLQLLKLEV